MFHKVPNTEMAHYLFALLSVGKSIPDKHKDEVMKVFHSCHSRQDVLNKIIELCAPANTSEKRFLTAKALAWSTVAYRKKAIEAITIYLENDIYEGAYSNSYHSFPWIGEINEKNFHLADMHFDLGKAYEGEYMFWEAFNEYALSNKLIPFIYGYVSAACNALIKMNDLNAALTYCKSFKSSPYLQVFEYVTPNGEKHINSDFYDGINKKIQDIEDKIQKGYIYKPRKRKQ